MAVITLRTTMEVATDISFGLRYADIRPNDKNIRVGDTIKYEVYYKQKRISHSIDGQRYTVTAVDRNEPRIMKGYSMIFLKPIATRW